MVRTLLIAMLAVGLAACADPAATPNADAPAGAADPTALDGVWIFEPEGGGLFVCIMKLDPAHGGAAPGANDAWLSGGCEGAFSFLAALAGWEEMAGGGVRLLGAEGSVLGEFTPNGEGVLTGVVANDGQRYRLRRAAG